MRDEFGAESGSGRSSWLYRETRPAIVLPYLMIAVILGLNFATARDPIFTPLLATAPALAGIGTARPWRPIAAGTIAVLAFLAQAGQWRADEDVIELIAILVVTAISALAVLTEGLRREELESVRAIAEAAQRVLLRPVPARLDGLRIAVAYRAAARGASIGGDIYDVASTPYGVRMLLGDVCGKGLRSVRTGADVLGAFREAARVEPDLATLAARLHDTVAYGARASGASGEPGAPFVTAVLLSIPDGRRRTELVNCGHPFPLLVSDGKATTIDPPEPAPPLGLLDLVGGAYRDQRLDLSPGDLLLLYTDGVTEARDSAGNFYPLADRLGTIREDDPGAVLRRIEHDVLDYAGPGPSDDAAMLAVRLAEG